MIREYKLYHGAVLAELIDQAGQAISIEDLSTSGRLASYGLNGVTGLYIKHSAQRMRPWQFTFTKSNLTDLLSLAQAYESVCIALICHTDGIACLEINELISLLKVNETYQAWVRLDRRRGKWYHVSGSTGVSFKKPRGLDPLLEKLKIERRCDIREDADREEEPDQPAAFAEDGIGEDAML